MTRNEPEVLASPSPEVPEFTTEDASELYRIESWSDGYFRVNDRGNIAVSPLREDPALSIDLAHVVADLKRQNVSLPVLIRFQDVLRGRVEQLNEAFARAIEEFGYGNRYRGVYPIKVNQLHEVVEEVLEAGIPYGMGLECGSKAELVAALPHLESDDTLLICNGYKDADMLRLILTGQRLGKKVIPVVEKPDELDRLLRLAAEVSFKPRFGVRVNLFTGGVGRWATSSGDQSKFGLTIPELLLMLERLHEEDLQESLQLLHFHLGSQISDIQILKQAVKEITQTYAQLHKRGIPVQYVDVGGGLGVSYVSGYSDATDGINYTLSEYANSVVYAVKEVCDAEQVPPPIIVSESGRAITAHHSVLIVEALSAYRKGTVSYRRTPDPDDHAVVAELFDAVQRARTYDAEMPVGRLLEAYHDAVEKRQQAHLLYELGYLSLEQRGLAESLFWETCRAVHTQIEQIPEAEVPGELWNLDDQLVDLYLCDFSVFQSILDHWAIGQRFPIVPLSRLDERPTRRAVLVDLTCDSDGKVSSYISPDSDKRYLEVHALREGEPYYLAFFLMGAYQDIMGDMHNLFGRVSEAHIYADADEPEGYYIEKLIPGATIQEMLALVQYFPNDLHRRMNRLIRKKVTEGVIRPKAGVEMLERYDQAFQKFTYFDPREF